MNSKLVIVVFFFTSLGNGSTSDSTEKCSGTIYVSKTRGTGKMYCGSLQLPCKTLDKGLSKLCWGGKLFIDGEVTKQYPYFCLRYNKLVIRNSLLLESYGTKPAYVLCRNGIEFHSLEKNTTNITIKGISFSETNIVLKDTSAVFQDCVFKRSSPAIDIKVSKQMSQYVLNVSNSVFQGNMGCILINSKTGRCNTVNMNLNNVVFQENTVLNNDEESLGIVSLQGALACSNEQTTVTSHWVNVTVTKNRLTAPITKLQTTPQFDRSSATTSTLASSFFGVHAHSSNLSFLQVTSNNNTELRFVIVNTSSYSNVSVTDCRFHGHRLTNNTGGVFYVTSFRQDDSYAQVLIKNSEFWSNVATHGGVLQIDAKQVVYLTIVNSTILQSYGSISGCAVCVGMSYTSKSKGLVGKLFVMFDGLEILSCHPPCQEKIRLKCFDKHIGTVSLISTNVLQAVIKNSEFRNNINVFQSTLLIKHKGDGRNQNNTLHVVVLNTIFDKNTSPHIIRYIPVFQICVCSPEYMKHSMVTILKSVFKKSKLGIAFRTEDVAHLYVDEVACTMVERTCFVLLNKKKQPNVSILIENTLFSKNYANPLIIEQANVNYSSVFIRNSTFHKNKIHTSDPIRISIQLLSYGARPIPSEIVFGRVVLEQVKFTSNVISNSALLQFSIHRHNGTFFVLMWNCEFQHNQQTHDDSMSKISNLVFLRMPFDSMTTKKCSSVYNYNTSFSFENVIFNNNTCYSSLIYINNGQTKFRRCIFKDNFSRKPTISAYIFVEHGTASIEFENTTVSQSILKSFNQKTQRPAFVKRSYIMPFVYFGAKGPFISRNSSFILNVAELSTKIFAIQNAGYIHLDNNTNLECPVGSYIDIENSSYIVPRVSTPTNCVINITRINYVCRRCPIGTYSLLRGAYRGTHKTYIECFICPFGGQCSNNIQSKWTFWGYKTVSYPPQLNFTRCPDNYCGYRKHHTNKSVFNYCTGNRTGIMCGSCKKGFTENMFNHRCRPDHECKDRWFWLVAVFYSVAMALYIMYQPSIVSLLVRKVLWFPKVKKRNSEQHEHGYSKIIFFFYQIAVLYIIDPGKLIHKYKILFSIVSLYNFEFELIESTSGCPFPGLNAVTKEAFLSSQVFAAMAVVVVIYMFYWMICLLARRTRPTFAPYIAAIIEILLLGYERLGHTSLELLNCAPLRINGRTEWRLFLDGNITCWVHWWQYALIAYNIIFIVPFLVVLLIGTTKLRRQQISALQFVAACFVPLPFLVYWFFQRCAKIAPTCETSYKEMRKTILEVIESPFRPPSSQSNGTLYWESILIGRRLMFLCLRFLISSPMFELFSLTLLSVTVLVHEVFVLPYKDNKANALSILTLSINVVLATVNLCKSTLYSFGIVPEGRANLHFQRLQLIEIALLCFLPGTIVVLVVVAIIAQVVRMIVKVYHYAFPTSQTISTNMDEQRRDEVTQSLICPVASESESSISTIN